MVAAAHVSYPVVGVGMITLDNPPHNHGSFKLMEKVEEAIKKIEATGAKVIMMVSDHPKYFCSGAYLPDMQGVREGKALTGDRLVWYRVSKALASGPLISIAVNNGIALGGGAELNWACDIRLAGESAVYGQVECLVDDIPGCGGTVYLPRLVGKGKAMEIVVTGRPFSAREMWHFGAVNQVYPDDKLRERSIKFASCIAQNPSNSLRCCKQSINEQWDLPLRDALKNETRVRNGITPSQKGLEVFNKAIKVYESGGDSYEAYGLEIPPKEYPY